MAVCATICAYTHNIHYDVDMPQVHQKRIFSVEKIATYDVHNNRWSLVND